MRRKSEGSAAPARPGGELGFPSLNSPTAEIAIERDRDRSVAGSENYSGGLLSLVR